MQDATAADESRPRRRSANLTAVEKLPRSPHLRPYQVEAQQAIVEHRRRGVRTQLVSLATGLGKCVDPQTWVWSNGLRRFSDAWGSRRIAGPQQTDEVVGWYDDGVNPGRRIVTAAGLTIDGTLAHRVWIRRSDGFEGWCRLEDARSGDYVAVARGRAHFGSTKLFDHTAYDLGRASAAADSLEALSSARGTSERRKHGATLTLPAPAAQRTVPEAVLSGTRETVRAYLRGYLNVDQAAARAGYTTSSRVLAEAVQQLSLALGIFCRLRTVASADGPERYALDVYDREAFTRELGFAPLDRLEDRCCDIVPGVAALVRELPPDVTGAWGAQDAPSYAQVRGWLTAAPECDATRELARIVAEHRAWTPIVEISDSAIRRIDCQVESSHAFVGNGIVNHNTVIIATLPKILGLREGDVTLVVAHRDELIEQIV